MTRARGTRRRLPSWVIGALTLYSAAAAHAQAPWGLGRWQGDVNFLTSWENQVNQSPHTKYDSVLFQERLGLRNTGGFIVDPRFLTLNLGGSFGLSQEEGIGNTQSPLRVGNGTLYDYGVDGLFFSDSAYPLTLFAARDENTLNQGFGGRSDVTFESHGGIWELREGNGLERYGFRNFSSLLDVHQELLKENSAVFGTPYERDETHNIVRYRARKGFETSDFYLTYELNDVHDPLYPTDALDSNTVRATYSLDFGPTLNRRWDSTVYYFTRSGSSSGSYVSLDEGLHLDHNQSFTTDYHYDFSQSNSDVGVTTSNAADFSLLHRLYPTLTQTLGTQAMHQEFPTGGQTTGGAQTGLDYRRLIPWGGQLFADTYVGYQVADNNFTSSSVQVVDEPHRAPPVLGAGAGFTLDNSFVQNDTIVMVDVRGGARLPTTLGVDYVLSQEGSLTEIIPLPGSAVIQPGDPLEVDYTYNVNPSITFSTTTFTAATGVDFAWIAASYEFLFSDQTRLSGTATPGSLIDSNINRLKLDLRHQWESVLAQSTVAYEIISSTIVDTTGWRFGQLINYQPRPDILAQLSGDQYFVDYPGEDRHTQSHLVRATVNWVMPAGVTISGFSGYRAYYETHVPSDEIIDCGARLHWTYQKLEVAPSFAWTDYQHKLTDVRAELRITRHLF